MTEMKWPPDDDSPFSIEVGGTVEVGDIPTLDRAIEVMGPLAQKHPGSPVRILDRYGEEVGFAREPPRGV
jgi:hypothetical protein